MCLLPFGTPEKHGPSGPTGTDLLNVRYATFKAMEQEYAVVFPEYSIRAIRPCRPELPPQSPASMATLAKPK